MKMNILIAGDGGQGVQTLADIIVQAVFVKNWQVSFIPNYGLEQRGGISLAFIKISDQPITYPKFSYADLAIIFSKEANDRIKNLINEKTKVVDYKKMEVVLTEKRIKNSSLNIFFLGVMTSILKNKQLIDLQDVQNFLEKKLKNKTNWAENKNAFQVGLSL